MEAIQKYPWGKGTITYSRDATANDSDKTVLTVPTGKLAKIFFVYGEITTTANAGNRRLRIDIGDGTNVINVCEPTSNITANQRGTLLAMPYVARNTNAQYLTDGNAANVSMITPIPDLVIPAGYTVRVWDIAAVDAAADDMVTVIYYVLYDA